MKATIEKDWVSKSGFRCCVVMNGFDFDSDMIGNINFNSFGMKSKWRCGYVAVTKNNLLYDKNYNEEIDVSKETKDLVLNGPINERGVIPMICSIQNSGEENKISVDVLFDVHGSITYSQATFPCDLIDDKGLWWFGFDCNHYGDTLLNRDLDYCVKECERLAGQFSDYKKIKSKGKVRVF